MVAKALDDTGHSGGWNHEIHWHRLSLTFTTALTFGKFNAASSSPTAVQLPRADSAFRAAPGSQATALKVSGAPRRRGRGSCCDAATTCRTPLANPVTYTCKRCDDRVRPGADDARKHLYAGPPWRTLSRGSMRRWRICWFTVGLPSTAFTLHVAVTWNARSVRMRPNGSPNNDRQYWFQRARKVPGGNEVLLTNGLHHGCASDAEAVEFLQCAARPGLCALRERSCGVPAVSARLSR